MKKNIIILLFCLCYYLSQAQDKVNVLYFDGVRKDKIYFTWEVESKLKSLTYIIEASNDRINYEDVFAYKTEHKKFNTSILLNFIYFRLKIMTTKDCFIYSDIIYVKDNDFIKIFPDPHGSNTIYVTSQEKGVCYIYNKSHQVIHTQNINEGHNQVCYNDLLKGEYQIKIFTENNFKEIRFYVK